MSGSGVGRREGDQGGPSLSWIADPRLDSALDELLALPSAQRPLALDRLARGDAADAELGRALRSVLAEEESEDFLTLGGGDTPLWRDLRVHLVPAPALESGVELGPWRVVEELGRGGMGGVYLAERCDGQFDQRVAIKVLETTLGLFTTQLFERERRILAALDHPGIARILDGGTTPDGRPYTVMEHVEGDAVDVHCATQRLAVEKRLALFCQIADAVAAAHRALVVHRDLKPANILVRPDGQVKLLDFGIASLSLPDDGVEKAERTPDPRAMTPRWASPEQIAGRPVTTASDVYQLGLLLRHLLESEDVLPRDLDAILAQACAHEPERRYDSVAELRQDVARHLQSVPVRARPAHLSYVARRFVRRHRVGVGAVVGACALILGLVAFYTIRLRDEREAARREAARAGETAAFLQSLFEGADPRSTGGREPSVRELLERGSTRIAAELGADPSLRAHMIGLLGTIYTALGDHESARRHLETALASRRELLGDEHADVAVSLRDLARLDYKQGLYQTAEERLRQALRIQISIHGERHRTTAITHKDLGTVLLARGEWSEARRETKTALVTIETLLGSHHPDVIETMAGHGYVLLRVGEVQAARSLLDRALTLGRDVLGKGHPDLAYLCDYAAMAERRAGELERATALVREALEIRRSVLGDEHPQTLESLHNVALMLHLQGDSQEAEVFYRKAIAGRRAVLGDDHRSLALSIYSLAAVLEASDRLDEANALFREALAIQERSLGAEHWEVGRTLARIGANELKRGVPHQAEAALRRSVRLLEQTLPREDLEQAHPLLWLGWALTLTDRAAEAEGLLRRAVEVRRGALPATSPRIAEVEAAMGACLARLGQAVAARELLARATPVVAAELGERAWLTRQARAALAAIDPPAEHAGLAPGS
jgi:serine/threonine-protein kinase